MSARPRVCFLYIAQKHQVLHSLSIAHALARGWPDDGVMATLIEPDGRGRTAYLLTSNYRAILDYTCSNFYALSVGLLADAVER